MKAGMRENNPGANSRLDVESTRITTAVPSSDRRPQALASLSVDQHGILKDGHSSCISEETHDHISLLILYP